MSRALKVTGNHVMYDRGARYLRAIMSSTRFRSVNDKQLLDLFFVISRIIKVSEGVISRRLRLITLTGSTGA